MDFDSIKEYLATNGVDLAINVVAAIIILVVGRMVAKVVSSLVAKAVGKRAGDETVTRFVESLAYATLMVVVVLAAVGRLGVQTTSFVAILGAAGLAIGLALQGSLANFASGFLMLIFRPISVGEYVKVAGEEGVVNEVAIFTTTLLTPDNRTIIVGNSAVTGGNIINFSRQANRRVDLTFGIDYGDNIKLAKEALMDEMNKNPLILSEPAPFVGVAGLGDSSVDLACRPWCKSADYWAVHFGLTEAVKNRFDAEGISFPFPQQDVHMHTVS